jgi:hypothetical protein
MRAEGVTLPILPCPACGVLAVPQVSAGTGPYSLKATCRGCHKFLKWLPKALVKGQTMVASVNRMTLLGAIGRYGVTVSYHDNGTPRASFLLAVQEHSQDGKVFTTLVDCQVYGKKAEAAGELEAGQLVLFEGKLAKRKKGEQWDLVVSGFEVTPITAPLPTMTGSRN